MSLFKDKYRVESVRLPGHDYSSENDYYLTICLKNRREKLFGRIESDVVIFNEAGMAVEEVWTSLPARFANIRLGDFVFMPEHMHGIVRIIKNGGKDLSEMIGAFKSLSAQRIGGITGKKWGEIWQRGFFDHIIRGEIEHYFISEYIKNNPLKSNPDNYYKEWFELQEIRDKIEKAKKEKEAKEIEKDP